MTSFYLAGRVKRRDEFVRYRAQLEQSGHQVFSRWLDVHQGIHANREDMDRQTRAKYAQHDLEDIRRADGLVLFTEQQGQPDPPYGNGRLVEFGYAIAAHKLLYVIGPPENLFVCLRQVWSYATWKEFFDAVGKTVWRTDGLGNTIPAH